MKTCSICNILKNESEFYLKKYRKEDELRADCKECFKKQVATYGRQHSEKISNDKKEYYRQNLDVIKAKCNHVRSEKKNIIEMAKNNPCHDCNKQFPSCAMDFDHREPENKKAGISRILNSSYFVDILLTELAKCDLVCACCHRNRTHKLWQSKVKKRKYPSKEAKQQFIDSHKIGKPCVDCGNLFNPWQMDFDHVNGVKLFKVSNLISLSCTTEQILEEIKKCELVCVNCHRVRTQERAIWLSRS